MLKLNRIVVVSFVTLFAYSSLLLNVKAQRSSDQPDLLKPYTFCTFDDVLRVTNYERLRKSEVYSRGVQTAAGEKEVTRIDGYRMLVAYPKTDAFASIRPEKSRPDGYAQDKQNVIAELKHLISTGKEMESAEPIEATYNGFESYGLNRRSIEIGNTIGVYVLFNDADQTITTIYFFNAKPKKRKFQTIEEWKTLKESFLNNYTRCVNNNSGR
jgi:hypothetical protein